MSLDAELYIMPEDIPQPDYPSREDGLPASIEAEKTILGSIMQDNALWFAVSETLSGQEFALDSHRRIFGGISMLMRAGTAVDYITLCEALTTSKQIDQVGGWSYVGSLTEGLPHHANVDAHIAIVRDKAQLRRMIVLGSDMVTKCGDQSIAAVDMLASFEKQLLDIAADTNSADTLENTSEEVFERLMRQRYGEEQVFIPSGIPQVDSGYEGYALRELTVLGGKPGQGKSSAVAQAVAANCSKGNPCDAYVPEMGSEGMLRRLWSIVSGVEFHKIRHPQRMSDTELSYLRASKNDIAKWPLFLCGDSWLAPEDVVNKAKVGKLRRGTKLVAIDYLQYLKFPSFNRPEAIGRATEAFAKLAKDIEAAVLLLCSVTEKQGAHRNDPPTMDDLRYCGDIKYHAHSVYLIHRCINLDTEVIEKQGQLILGKARSDMGGAKDFNFDTNYLTFY